VKYNNDSVVLRWNKPAATSNELQIAKRFVIYRSTSPVIDLENQANIQAITVNDTTGYRDTKITANTTYYYVVTSLDRLYNESTASNMADNLPPVITCPGDDTISTSSTCTVTVPDYRSLVAVDGFDAGENPRITVSQSPVPGTVLTGVDTTSVTLTATDPGGNSSNCYLVITRIDDTPPVISNASADPSVIWAPNHKMKNVNVSYTVTDNCGPVTTTLTVTSNEPETGLGSGDTGPDFELVSNTKVKVRAERGGTGTGRIYTITITATDASGNTTSQNVIVSVPHDHSDITTRRAPTSVSVAEKNLLSVQASPNPSSGPFTITINSGSAEKISLRVMNIDGRVMEKKMNIAPNCTLTIGSGYLPGNYYIEVIQGKQSRMLKVMKQ
jgi:fibronectin type 3 domain-containing protein